MVVLSDSEALAPSTLVLGRLVAMRSEMKFCADEDVASLRLDTEAEKPELREVLCLLLIAVLAALPGSPAAATWPDILRGVYDTVLRRLLVVILRTWDVLMSCCSQL